MEPTLFNILIEFMIFLFFRLFICLIWDCVFCKKVKMESSKQTTVVLLEREKRAITNYYIIKPNLQQQRFLILTQLWRNSI
jgi:hypothetical protein